MPKGYAHLSSVTRTAGAPVSNRENLRKQAKQYVRWHRNGYYPVAAQIRAMLPRFHHRTDVQVVKHPFKLSDAQELVARQSGFKNGRPQAALRRRSRRSMRVLRVETGLHRHVHVWRTALLRPGRAAQSCELADGARCPAAGDASWR